MRVEGEGRRAPRGQPACGPIRPTLAFNLNTQPHLFVPSQVLAVGTECDIAMLTVADPAFWEGLRPVNFGRLPRLQEQVTVIGFPIGGDTMSVTSGVVSRIEVTSYVHGSTELLGVQIDAAINSGNSGGPVFNRAGECVGIAFQSMAGSGDAENIGRSHSCFHVSSFLFLPSPITCLAILGSPWLAGPWSRNAPHPAPAHPTHPQATSSRRPSSNISSPISSAMARSPASRCWGWTGRSWSRPTCGGPWA